MFKALHRYSNLFSHKKQISDHIDAIETLMSAAKMGLFPYEESLYLFQKKSFTLYTAQKHDISALVELEKSCWPQEICATAEELKTRVTQFPEGQLVLKIDNRIVAAVYMQKIADLNALQQITYHKNHTLHDTNGNIIRLLGISVAPDMQNNGLGDQLMEFVLCWSRYRGDIKKIVGITRCKSYIQHNHLTMEQYVDKHINTPNGVDPILRFHTNRGASITSIVPNYRPEDKDNHGIGILIEYDLENFSLDKKNNSTKDSLKNDKNITEIATDCIKKLIPKKYIDGFSMSRPLMEMGFDSLSLLELRILLNNTFRLELSTTFFFEYNTPLAIIQFLTNQYESTSATHNSISHNDPIAVIGMACRLPGNVDNTNDFWELLQSGRDAITPIPTERQTYLDNSISYGGFLKNIDYFDAKFFHISPREAELMDPQQRILLETAWEALENAGLDPTQLSGTQTGIFVGMFSHDYATLLQKNKNLQDIDIYFATGNSASVSAGRLAYALDLQGPTMVVDTACSSSLVAVHLACQSLRQGECDIALAAGVNLILSPEMNIAFANAGMLSPSGRCKTFDATADGYVRSEGSAVIIFKKLSQALLDEDNILAVIKSTVINQDGASNGLTAPNKAAQKNLLRSALQAARLQPCDISYIETHGTGTALGDPIEVHAISDVYASSSLSLGAVKSVIGHTEATAGIAGLIKVILMLQHQHIPGNLHFKTLNPHIENITKNLYFPTQLTPWTQTPRRAGISSFGFSGTNAHAIVEAAPISTTQVIQPTKPAYLIAVSAKTDTALMQKIKDLARWLATAPSDPALLEKISYTLTAGRTHFEKRHAFVVCDLKELRATLQQLSEDNELSQTNTPTFSVSEFDIFLQKVKHLTSLCPTDYYAKLIEFADFYNAGYDFSWASLALTTSKNKIALPTYPFERKRYWFNTQKRQENSMPSKRLSLDTYFPHYHEIENTPYFGNEVLLEFLNENIAIVKMSDKKNRNMLTKELFHGLHAKFKEIKENPNIKVVILTGYENIFCMGGDEQSLRSISEKKMKFTELAFVYRGLLECEIPVIAAMQGHAHGGGFTFGLYADIVILSEQSTYAASFMQYGFTPGVGSTFILKEKLGNIATEMMFTAKLYTGEELKKRTSAIIFKPQEEVLKEAIHIAIILAEKPLSALKVLKQELSKKILEELPLVLEAELSMHEKTFSTPEVKEKINTVFQPTSTPISQETTMKTNSFVNVNDIQTALSKIIAKITFHPAEEISLTLSFGNLGIDSIAAVEIIRDINQQFNLSLEAANLYSHPSIEKLSAFIAEKVSHIQQLHAHAYTELKPSNKIPQDRDIAIIGMSGRFPDAENVDVFWENIAAGLNSIRSIPKERWNHDIYFSKDPSIPNKTYSQVGAFISDIDLFDPAFFNLSPKEAEVMDPQQRLFLQEAWRALEDAGYSDQAISGLKCGVFVGVSAGDYGDLLNSAGLKNTAFAFTGLSPAILAARISYLLNLKGPSLAIDTACSSSLVALCQAYESILSGESDIALAGGVALMTTPQAHIVTAKAGMLSPTDSCRAFDENADGIALGEGVGVLVLKPLKKALSDGNTIYGVIKATAINQDGMTSGLTAPNPEAQTALQLSVYKKANISPENISYVEAHGTGTALGDPIEVSALIDAHRQFSQKNQYAALGSVKANIGHTTMAAGIASVIKVLLAFKHKKIPPQINFSTLNHRIKLENSPFYINTYLQPWTTPNNSVRYATVSSFGFSGTNAHILLSEAPEQSSKHSISSKPAYLVTLSAKTEAALLQRVKDLAKWINHSACLENIAYTLNMGRSHFEKRCAIIATSIQDLQNTLQNIINTHQIIGIFGNKQDEHLLSLAASYCGGHKIDWITLHQHETHQFISLPTYPFAKERYWYDSYQQPVVETISQESNFSNNKVNAVTVNITEDHIAIIQIIDKVNKNQLSMQLLEALETCFNEAASHPDIKVIVLTGYDDIFCLGGSEDGLISISKGDMKYTDMPFIYRGLLDCKIPVVAAMQGHAFGAGLTFGLYADLVVMSEDHLYTANFMKYGFTPGVGSTLILNEKLSESLATEMMWTAKDYPGSELKARGATVIFKPGKEVLHEAMMLAKTLAKKSQQALITFKKDRSSILLKKLSSTIDRELQMHSEIFTNPDATENIQQHFTKLANFNTPTTPVESKNFSSKKIALKSIHDTSTTLQVTEPVSFQLKNILSDAPTDIAQIILNIVSHKLHIAEDKIDIRRSLNELGIDSISAVEVIRDINRQFKLNFEAAIIYDYPSIQALSAYIQNTVHSCKTEVEKKTQDSIVDYDIAIIGFSGRFPGADDLETYWENLKQGISSVSEIPKDRWSIDTFYDENPKQPNKTYSKWGGFLNNIDLFDPLFFNISPAQAEQMDPQQRLFLEECWKVFEIAGYSAKELQGKKCSVFVGASTGDYTHQLMLAGIETDAQCLLGTNPSILAARISYHLDLKGASIATDTACSSSLVAIHQACQSLWSGESEMALAGGVCILTSPQMHIMTSKAGMLSPDGQCKTFDNTANGFVPSEGVGVLLLKPLKKALQDGDIIHAVIKGSGINQDGKTNGITAPSGKSQMELIHDTYDRFNINPETITYIETHGTGTKIGDPIEVGALTHAFQTYTDKRNYCALGSVKPNIGHALFAAGIASVIKVILCLKHKKIVPSIHVSKQNEHIQLNESPFYLSTTLKDWQNNQHITRRAGISSFGFSGTNAHLILEEAPVMKKQSSSVAKPYYLITLSAQTESALKQRLIDLKNWIALHIHFLSDKRQLEAISYTLNAGRTHFDWRCALVVKSLDELAAHLSDIEIIGPPTYFLQKITSHELQNKPIFDELLTKIWQEIHDPSSLSEDLYKKKLLTLSHLYMTGCEIDWQRLHANETQEKIILPTYPFAREHYWIPKNSTALQFYENNNNLKHESILEKIIQITAEVLKIEPSKLNANQALSAYGMDSINMTTLTNVVNERLQLSLTPAILFEHATLESFANYIVTQHEQIPNKKISKSTHEEKTDDIAVIGMHGILPDADNLDQFWENLINGKNVISEIPKDRWDWEEFYGDPFSGATKTNVKWGGFINNIAGFDAEFFNISPREAELIDPQQRLFLEVAWKTIEDAGYATHELASNKTGVFVGVVSSDYAEILQKNNTTDSATLIGNTRCMIANRVSYLLNLQGPSEVIDTACSSSLVAIHRAIQALHHHECDVAIVGGANALLSPTPYFSASKAGMLSIEGKCRTFDKNAQGYVRSEGVAAVLLKPYDKAKHDGDHIYAVIKGSSTNHGGHVNSLTVPNPNAQANVVQTAWKQASINVNTISYIEVHGTGTALGDPIEINGLKKAFDSLATEQDKILTQHYCGLGSTKSHMGHAEATAGIIGLIKTILSMQHEFIPGNLHFNELNPFIKLENSPFYLVNKTQHWSRLKDHSNLDIPRRAGVSSFGFGGVNAHVVIEEAPHVPTTPITKPFYLITLSAKEPQSLKQKIIDLHDWLLTRQPHVDLCSLSFTLNVGRNHFDYRSAWVVHTIEELLISLEKPVQPVTPIANPKDVYESILASLTIQNYHENLIQLSHLYLQKHPIDFNILYKDDKIIRLASLPTYPFLKKHYWVAKQEETKVATNNDLLDTNDSYLIYLKNIFSEKLKISPEKISIDSTYEVYGIDSLLSIEITKRLEEDFGALPKTLLYEKNNLSDLAKYLQKKTVKTPDCKNPATGINSQKTDDIAIIGLAGTYPQADDIQTFWNNLESGRDSITDVPSERWNYKDYPVEIGDEKKYQQYGGFIADVDKFDPLFFNIAPRDAALMDPQERLFMQCAWATLEDAGYTREMLQKLADNNVGVFVGVTYNFYPLFIAEEWQKGNRIPLDIQLFSIANRLSYFLNLNGPSFVIDTACSSSASAIHLACESILRGECKMAIAGGVNLSLHPSKYHMLGSYNFMSENGRCNSFGTNGTGYVPGEGVGAVLLKPLSLAIEDNDQIYAVIKSSSMNHGGKTSGYTVPNPSAQTELIKNGLKKANIHARTISYIEAHGTGTALGDPIEIRGLQEAFEEDTDDKQFCAIGSVKSNIGHLESAAGISQLTKVLLQMRHQKLVPSLHAKTLNPLIEFEKTPFVVQQQLAPWPANADHPRRAGISSFGAGGANVHFIIEEYLYKEIINNINYPSSYLFLLSAKNKDRLKEYAEKVKIFLQKEEISYPSFEQQKNWLRSICYTYQTGREAMSSRLAIVTTSCQDLIKKLTSYIETEKNSEHVWVNDISQMNNIVIGSDYEKLAEAWTQGAAINWDTLYEENKPQKISLPTYPFAKRRCWITTENTIEHQTTDLANDWLYSLQWTIKEEKFKNTTTNTGNWLVFADDDLTPYLREELQEQKIITCYYAKQFNQSNENTFYINPHVEDDYKKLFTSLQNKSINGIIYLANFLGDLDPSLPMFYLFKFLSQWDVQLSFNLITRSSQSINENDPIQIWHHYLWSITQVFAAECPNYKVLLLDLDFKKQYQHDAKIIVHEIQQFTAQENHLAYRHQERYVLKLKKFTTQQQPSHTEQWQAPKTALITGGLGALGSEVALWLAKQGTTHLLLTGTTELPDQLMWPVIQNKNLKDKINTLLALKEMGVKVQYAAVDITDKHKMHQLITKTETMWNSHIQGVFHLAGLTTDNIKIESMSTELFQKVLSIKVQGAMVLHDLFDRNDLNCFVLFSSTSALPYFGIGGLSAYAMANEFLNGLALFRRQQKLPAISINWTAWAEKGMSFKYNHSAFLQAVGLSTVSLSDGMQILKTLLTLNPTVIAVMKADWKTFLRINPEFRSLTFFDLFSEKIALSHLSNQPLQNEVINTISTILSKLLDLKLQEVDPSISLQEYGMDSILGINFIGKVNAHYPDSFSPMDLYRYPTINQLTQKIISFSMKNEETKELSDEDIEKLIENELLEI